MPTCLMVLKKHKKLHKINKKAPFKREMGVDKRGLRVPKVPLRLGEGKRNRMMCVPCEDNIIDCLMGAQKHKKVHKIKKNQLASEKWVQQNNV
jgi:hypothetical protein